MAQLQGTVKRIIFCSEDTNFFVFALEDRSDQSVKKVKGTFALDRPYPAQELTVTGQWEKTKYGPTFAAHSLEPAKPTTTEGIERYLIEYVDRIGKVTARRLVETFGTETLDVLSNQPERLDEVPRLNKVQRQKLIDEWCNFNQYRDVAIQLLNLDIPTGAVSRIYETWGTDAIEKVNENPYCLMQLRGIGFLTADRIALQLGIKPDSPFRIGACIQYSLEQASSAAGHLYLPIQSLEPQVRRLIRRNEVTDIGRRLTTEDLRFALSELMDKDAIVCDGSKVYLTPNYQHEAASAELLAEFIGSHSLFDVDVPEFINQYQNDHSIEFSDEQSEAIRALHNNRVVLVTGLPGTGKTTVTRALVRLFKSENLRFELLSPTGIAAKKLSNVVGETASTIHRALGYKEGSDWVYNERNKLGTDAVIVDECSMVDQEVFCRLLLALEPSTLLVLVGDAAQLPSVGAGNVLHELIRSEAVCRVNLTQIFRQEEASDIVLNAHKINAGELPQIGDPVSAKTDFRFIPRNADEDIRTGILNTIERIHDRSEGSTYQVLSPRWGGELGVTRLNEEIREVLNPLEMQREVTLKSNLFRVGDRIIVTRNDYEKGVFNGEVGRIDGINSKQGELEVTIFDEVRMDKQVKFSYQEAPDLLNPAFAITIHKSQGLEYDYVVMPFVTGFSIQLQRNLLYTAITRARRKVFIFGHWEAITKAVENDEVQDRYTAFSERLRAALGV